MEKPLLVILHVLHRVDASLEAVCARVSWEKRLLMRRHTSREYILTFDLLRSHIPFCEREDSLAMIREHQGTRVSKRVYLCVNTLDIPAKVRTFAQMLTPGQFPSTRFIESCHLPASFSTTEIHCFPCKHQLLLNECVLRFCT